MRIPTVACVPTEDGKTWQFWCSHCEKLHTHSAGAGHREAHCFRSDSPFLKTGYKLISWGAAKRRRGRPEYDGK